MQTLEARQRKRNKLKVRQDLAIEKVINPWSDIFQE